MPLSVLLALRSDSQFKGQEPGTDDEVLQFCQLNYGVTFPLAKKASIESPLTPGTSEPTAHNPISISCLTMSCVR